MYKRLRGPGSPQVQVQIWILAGARTQQLNSHASGGAAFVCRICFENLQNQWKQYEKVFKITIARIYPYEIE